MIQFHIHNYVAHFTMNSISRTTLFKTSELDEVLAPVLLVSKTKSVVSWFKAVVNSSSSSASQTYINFVDKITIAECNTCCTCDVSSVKFLHSTLVEHIVSSEYSSELLHKPESIPI